MSKPRRKPELKAHRLDARAPSERLADLAGSRALRDSRGPVFTGPRVVTPAGYVVTLRDFLGLSSRRP